MWKLAEQEKNFGFSIQGTLDTVFVVLERYDFRQRIIEPTVVVAGQEQPQEKLTTFFITDDRFNNLMNVIPDFFFDLWCGVGGPVGYDRTNSAT